MNSFDIIVIGMGPGGEHVAGSLAERGLSVLGIDNGLVGGECPYYGCIPSKMMIRGANALAEAGRVSKLSGSVGQIEPDWAPIAERIRSQATDNWDDTVAVDRFEGKGGTFLRATGRIVAPGIVEAGDQQFRAERAIVVATGTSAAIPPIPGLAGVDYWTNREAVQTETVPDSLIVLGGGAIGSELAQVFARFGSQVTLVEAAPRLLPVEEPEVGETIAQVFTKEGITVLTGISAESVSHSDSQGFQVQLSDGSTINAQRLLVATGRRADPAGVGLPAVGVSASARVAPTNDHLQVTDGVWAVGDITGRGAFTHVAMYQADIVIRDILGETGPAANYHAVSRVTFTDPEAGSVGLSEAQAREALPNVRVGSTLVAHTARGWIHAEGNEGLIKLVEDADRGVLVGGTAMGPSGGEVLGLIALAVHARIPVADLRSMIYAYPTFHRGIEDAIRALA